MYIASKTLITSRPDGHIFAANDELSRGDFCIFPPFFLALHVSAASNSLNNLFPILLHDQLIASAIVLNYSIAKREPIMKHFSLNWLKRTVKNDCGRSVEVESIFAPIGSEVDDESFCSFVTG